MTTAAALETLRVGDAVPPLVVGPISRTILALFAGGSGDHNPVHIDSDAARRYGYDDVFCHGMLSMALMARMVTQWTPQPLLQDLRVRFVSIAPIGSVIRCTGQVTQISCTQDRRTVHLAIAAALEEGRRIVEGTATLTEGGPAESEPDPARAAMTRQPISRTGKAA